MPYGRPTDDLRAGRGRAALWMPPRRLWMPPRPRWGCHRARLWMPPRRADPSCYAIYSQDEHHTRRAGWAGRLAGCGLGWASTTRAALAGLAVGWLAVGWAGLGWLAV
ncbi:MAG TPA: hypothetical protein P5282_07080, partial [Anaerolineaceae bacterium]|nr:hypothetical protein [Anaerolineaceae bacterium]